MRNVVSWFRLNAPRLLAMLTLLAALGAALFAGYVGDKFDIKARALARSGSESAEYMGIVTMAVNEWFLPILIGVAVLSLATFVATLRHESKPTC